MKYWNLKNVEYSYGWGAAITNASFLLQINVLRVIITPEIKEIARWFGPSRIQHKITV